MSMKILDNFYSNINAFYEKHPKGARATEVSAIAFVAIGDLALFGVLLVGIAALVGGVGGPSLFHSLNSIFTPWAGLPICMIAAGGAGAFVLSGLLSGYGIKKIVSKVKKQDAFAALDAHKKKKRYVCDDSSPKTLQFKAKPIDNSETVIVDATLMQKIAKGGMNSVWLVYNQQDAQEEVLRLEDKKNEVGAKGLGIHKALNRDKIEGIVKIYGVIDEKGRKGVLMEYCEGGCLAAAFYNETSTKKLKKYVAQVFQALASIHEAGFTHRDIKPENIFIKNGRALIGDFDFAARIGDQIPPSGTESYAPPEYSWQRSLTADPNWDSWAAGLILYQLFFGSDAIKGLKNLEDRDEAFWKAFTRKLNTRLNESREIDDEVKKVMRGLLTIDPEKRLDMKTAAEALQGWL